MVKDVCIITSDKLCGDTYEYTVADEQQRVHKVHLHESLLKIEPTDFMRGSDKEHLDRLAAGAVLLDTGTDSTFHTLDKGQVDAAYRATLRIKSLYQIG